MYQLDIEADASENHWTCDHMCLAESNDGTPPIVHGAPNIDSSDGAFKYVLDNSISLCRINGSSQIIDLKVPSPEMPNKFRTLRVHIITLPQMHTINECKQYLRQTAFSVEYLINLRYFGNNDVLPTIDATILLGDFQLEEMLLPPKVLLIRLSGMLSNSSHSQQDKEIMAHNIYNSIRPLTGKKGYEMRRFGGSQE